MTNMVDEGLVKCVQYWPEIENQEEVYENIIIELTGTEVHAHFTIYTMKLRHVNDRKTVRYMYSILGLLVLLKYDRTEFP